jgi:hypothetical protein
LLPLDDPLWDQFQGNYSSGANVANLLTAAKSGAPVDKWYDDIFQELMHQYTLSEVAYAAVPHLVEIAEKNRDLRLEIMVLVGACYAHSTDPGVPEIPSRLSDAWIDARQRSLPVILDVLSESQLSENEIRYLLSSLAAIKGFNQMSIAIEALDTEVECPHCGEFFSIVR